MMRALARCGYALARHGSDRALTTVLGVKSPADARSLTRSVGSGSRLLWAGCLVAALAVWGCAPTAETQQLQTGESNIRSMVASDRQQIEALQEKIARLDDRISELEHNGGESDNKTIGALNARLSKLESQMRATQPTAAVPGAAGVAPGTPGTAAPATPGAPVPGAPGAPPAPGAAGASPPPDNSNAAGDEREAGDNGDTNAGTNVASAAPPASAAPAVAPPPAVSAAPSWQALLDQEIAAAQSSRDPAARSYRQGLAAMKAGRYPLALGKFQDLQRRYPKSALSEPAEYFSANALYELGQSDSQRGNHDRATENFNKAILQFNDLVMRFPSGRFASPSLLREAQAFINIEDRIDARLTLQKLLNDHGNSSEAPTARSMMQSLASE
jgi:TolA-binding protein